MRPIGPRIAFVLALLVVVAAGMRVGRSPRPDPPRPSGPAPAEVQSVPGDTGRTLAAPQIPAPQALFHGRFATAAQCAECHAGAEGSPAMRDEAGRSVAPFDLWQGSMMANSARDPIWRAAVSAEVARTPSRRVEIEAKCTRCHAPMASIAAHDAGSGPIGLATVYADTELGALARDGASCTACHQIADDGLGDERTYGGHPVLSEAREIFGPHPEPFPMPMRMHTGYTPTRGTHLLKSALCATCHTLFTDAVDADGVATGHRLPEQTPYLEWRRSAYTTEPRPTADSASCQSCHLPQTDEDGGDIETWIARTQGGRPFPPTRKRWPYGRHVLVGGNTWVPRILRAQRAELQPLATDAALLATERAARRQLREATASLSIEATSRTDEHVAFGVTVTNRAGHKLPTGIPTRRVVLRVRVFDGAGRKVWSSGELDAAGRLVDGQGAVLPSERVGGPALAHREQVDRTDQAQTYEAVMADPEGRPTFTLMRGATYLKDNRLLPRGFTLNGGSDSAAVRPAGVRADPDYAAPGAARGGDRVRYRVPALRSAGPHRVEATLLFQVLSGRFREELFSIDTPEIHALRRYLADPALVPEVIAEASVVVD